jgi:dedicated sortase system histidine kinase
MIKLPAFSLRVKLALVAVLLLALPWAGYNYVREMERFLLEGEEQALLATARGVATALHDRPGLMRAPPSRDDELRREAEEELRRLAAERGEPAAAPGAEGAPAADAAAIIDREASVAARREIAEISEILEGVERSTSRIWVVTKSLRVLALAGSLKREGGAVKETPIERALGWLIPRPNEDFDDAIADDALATGREIAGALAGRPGVRLRNTPDGKAVIISAAHPIWNGDEVAGAVVVEESTNPILSVRSLALERLLVVTLAVFAFAAAVLIWFATRISTRIRRLRDEAEAAIDAHGRLAHPHSRLITAQNSSDELGDLSRSFSAMLGKLSQHHAYLESMASRLSHELRTPIAVVRSSLENLKLAPADGRVYIERAEEGLRRLGTILTRMSEATRLEQGLASVEREAFDLAAVVSGCVEGYRLAYPAQPFELVVPSEKTIAGGSPDLAAQLLDKVVANAVDFSAAGGRGRPIRISLAVADGLIELGVENQGPLLPEAMREKLFESMVSVRAERHGEGTGVEPHLGLGLYIARLIAEFHGGEVRARNLASGEGVVVSATFRSA